MDSSIYQEEQSNLNLNESKNDQTSYMDYIAHLVKIKKKLKFMFQNTKLKASQPAKKATLPLKNK